MAARVVVTDASILVDLLAGTDRAAAVRGRLSGTAPQAPAHVDAEVLSALGRLHRVGELSAADVEAGLAQLAAMPLARHAVGELLVETWARRDQLRLVDALYVELASRMDAPLLTTDLRLARVWARAEPITG